MAFLVKTGRNRSGGPSNPGFAYLQQYVQVSRAAATLPATTTTSYFQVSGGRILVHLLLGEVTTVCSATATNLKVTSTPTVGTAVDVAANLAIASFEVGAILVVEGDGTALIGTSAGSGFAPALVQVPWVCPTGNIRLTTSATNTGATKWDLFYQPLDPTAVVVAV